MNNITRKCSGKPLEVVKCKHFAEDEQIDDELIVNSEGFLKKDNYLGEFKSESDKKRVQENIGINEIKNEIYNEILNKTANKVEIQLPSNATKEDIEALKELMHQYVVVDNLEEYDPSKNEDGVDYVLSADQGKYLYDLITYEKPGNFAGSLTSNPSDRSFYYGESISLPYTFKFTVISIPKYKGKVKLDDGNINIDIYKTINSKQTKEDTIKYSDYTDPIEIELGQSGEKIDHTNYNKYKIQATISTTQKDYNGNTAGKYDSGNLGFSIKYKLFYNFGDNLKIGSLNNTIDYQNKVLSIYNSSNAGYLYLAVPSNITASKILFSAASSCDEQLSSTLSYVEEVDHKISSTGLNVKYKIYKSAQKNNPGSYYFKIV